MKTILGEALTDLEWEGADPEHELCVRRRGIGRWAVSWDDTVAIDSGNASLAVYGALGAVSDAVVAGAESSEVALHAGCVEMDGLAVAFVGHSGAGKTTMTAAAVLRGHGFIGDEAALIDRLGNVRAFHRPLGLRSGGLRVLGLPPRRGPYAHVLPVPASSLGRLAEGARLGLVVLLCNEAGRPTEGRLRPAEALIRLSDHTLGGPETSRQAFRSLGDLVRSVPVVSIRNAACDEALRDIESFMSSVV